MSKPIIAASPTWLTYGAIAVLAIHATMLGYLAYRSSPTIDEPAHLAAGMSHLLTGSFDLYRVNPPLVRTLAAAPAASLGASFTWDGYSRTPGSRSEFVVGGNFVKRNASDLRLYFFASRLVGIVFSILGAVLCFCWGQQMFGSPCGAIALVLWCFCPNIVGHGHLLTPDVPAATTFLFSSYSLWRWLAAPSWRRALVVSIAVGLAALTKATCLILLLVIPAVVCVHVLHKAFEREGSVRRHAVKGASLCGLLAVGAIFIVNLGYGFEQTGARIGDIEFVSRFFAGDRKPGNITRGTVLERIRVPVPANLLRGLDEQKCDLEVGSWSYLNGVWRPKGWWYYYLYAFGVKVPLGSLALFVIAVVAFACGTTCKDQRWEVLLTQLVPSAVLVALVSSQTGFNHHFRYVYPALPLLYVFMSQGASACSPAWLRWAVVVCVFASVSESMSVYPNSMSFFNAAVGGPTQGHRHLLNSNIDWNQDVYVLRDWLEAHDVESCGVADTMSIDPRLLGLKVYFARQWDRRPALVEDGTYRPTPGWFAIGVNALLSFDNRFADFHKFVPVARVGMSFYVYHISENDVAQVMGSALAERDSK